MSRGSQRNVCQSFVNGDAKFDKASNMHQELRKDGAAILYSYEYHVIAVRVPGEVPMIIVNGDTNVNRGMYSNATAKHLSTLQSALRWKKFDTSVEYVTMSFSSLQPLKPFVFVVQKYICESFMDKSLLVLDHTEQESSAFHSLIGKMNVEAELRAQGRLKGATCFITNKDPDNERLIEGYYHIPETILLRYQNDIDDSLHYIVCGMDDNQYFASRIKGRHRTVGSALESMKPPIVRKADAEGREWYRQGEWFFIHHPVDNPKKLYSGMSMRKYLPDSTGSHGSHWATRGQEYKKGRLLVSGTIHHDGNEHPALQLSKADAPRIFLAVRNNVFESFTTLGRVD